MKTIWTPQEELDFPFALPHDPASEGLKVIRALKKWRQHRHAEAQRWGASKKP